MCIRALDYCPPVDITFGDYLRALITADYDLEREDERGYRIAVIEAFRRRGLYPRDVRSLSVDSLRWQPPTPAMTTVLYRILPSVNILRKMIQEWDRPGADPGEDEEYEDDYPSEAPQNGQPDEKEESGRSERRSDDRTSIYRRMRSQARLLGGHIKRVKERAEVPGGELIGLELAPDRLVEVHSVRPATRVRADGRTFFDLVVVITQSASAPPGAGSETPRFRGGCTLLIDPETREIRYCIVKNVRSESRRRRVEEYVHAFCDRAGLHREFHREGDDEGEPFAMIHRCEERGEDWL
jgi:hypothetical protein